MPTYSLGAMTKLGTINESTWGTPIVVDQAFDFINESIGKKGVILERDGIRGTVSRNSEDTRTGPYAVNGTLVMEPSPEELAVWLPRILGTAAAGTTFALADTPPLAFSMTIDRISKVYAYEGCRVNKATLSGSEGGIIRLSMDIVAQDEVVGNAGTFPTINGGLPTYNTAPFIFSDMVLTLVSAARQTKSFELTIDNNLDTGRFNNNLTITALERAGDRTVSLSTVHPYDTDHTALYAQALAGTINSTLVLTNAGYSMTNTFATLQVPPESPTIASKGETLLTLNMVARSVTTTKEIVIVLDSTA